jgi:hypothetical protein
MPQSNAVLSCRADRFHGCQCTVARRHCQTALPRPTPTDVERRLLLPAAGNSPDLRLTRHRHVTCLTPIDHPKPSYTTSPVAVSDHLRKGA